MLDKLILIQRARGWGDAEMAAQLGLARSTWTEIRNGKIPLSERSQLAAARAFPELVGELVTSVTVSGSVAAPSPS